MSIQPKRWVRTGIIALSVAALGCVSTYVYAKPSTSELAEKTSNLNKELDDLNGKLAGLLSEIDELAKEAEDMNTDLEKMQAELDVAQKKGEQQYEDMKLRIKYMYEAGDSSFLELLCSAESMSDFLNRSDFVKNVSEYDRKMLDELLATQEKIKKDNKELIKAHQELVAKQDVLKGKREELESLIASTSAELSDYQEQLDKARKAEALAKQKEAEQAALQAQQLANPGTSTPSVPQVSTEGKQLLGNFRITHYCNCFACCGSWAGGNTASGTVPTAGRTIAVDPSVIPMGSKVIINGMVFTAEDTGSAIKGNKIDIYVNSHSAALANGVYYADVYLAN